jgi:hypothetical protein
LKPAPGGVNVRSLLTKISMIAVSLVPLTGAAHAMSVMVRATGPYNYNCSVFVEGKPTERAAALAFAQGYAAAENMNLSFDKQVNLTVRWREFNARVARLCTDKSDSYLYRRFVNDAAAVALDDMRKEVVGTGKCTVAGEFVGGSDSKGVLNVRVAPNGKIVDETFPTIEVSICEQKGDWSLVEYNGQRGWIQRWFVKPR